MVGNRRRPARGELRLIGQPLSADLARRAVRPLPLRRRGAGAQARSSGQDRRRRYGLWRRTAGSARSRHSRLALDASLEDLGRAIGDGRLRRLAIANPAHAPYGRAARKALIRTALWPRLEGRLLLAENTAQAVQFALTRGADGGLVPYALALTERISSEARHVLLDASMHPPIAQRMVLLSHTGPEARALFEFLAGPEAQRIFQRFGFTAPNERAR